MSELKNANGVPEYITDPKTGNLILKEITLQLNEDIGLNPDYVKFLEERFSVSNLTSDEYLLSGFGHELEHGLGKEFNVTQRSVYLNKSFDEKTRKSMLYDIYIGSEEKARDRNVKILEEIKQYQQEDKLIHRDQWKK